MSFNSIKDYPFNSIAPVLDAILKSFNSIKDYLPRFLTNHGGPMKAFNSIKDYQAGGGGSIFSDPLVLSIPSRIILI